MGFLNGTERYRFPSIILCHTWAVKELLSYCEEFQTRQHKRKAGRVPSRLYRLWRFIVSAQNKPHPAARELWCLMFFGLLTSEQRHQPWPWIGQRCTSQNHFLLNERFATTLPQASASLNRFRFNSYPGLVAQPEDSSKLIQIRAKA